MSLDPIIYAEVKKIQPAVGSLLEVPENFSDPNYLSTGTIFSPDDYPELASKIMPRFNADKFDKIVAPTPTTKFSNTADSGLNLGTFIISFVFDGDFYAVTSLGHIFKMPETSENADALMFVATLPLDGGNILPSNITVANDRLYFSAALPTYYTAFVPLNDLTAIPIRTSHSVNSQTRVKYANGLYVAIYTLIAGSTITTSTDGITFAPVAANFTSTFIPRDLDYGNGVWLIVTNGTAANNFSTSSDGVTWIPRNGPTTVATLVVYNTILGTWVLSSGTQFYTTSDLSSWTPRVQGGPAGSMIGLNILPNGTIVAYAQKSSIQVSTDAVTFINRAVGNASYVLGSPFASSHFAVPMQNKIVLLGTVGDAGQYYGSVSTDNGATWPNPRKLILRNTTSAEIFSFLADNLTGIAFDAFPGERSKDLSYRLTTDGGLTWQSRQVAFPTVIAFNQIAATKDRFVLQVTQQTLTGGGTGNPYFTNSTDGQNWATPFLSSQSAAYQLTTLGDNLLYSHHNSAAAGYVSADFGQTWAARNSNVIPTKILTINKNVFVIGVGSGNISIYGMTTLSNTGAVAGNLNSTPPITVTTPNSATVSVATGGLRAIVSVNATSTCVITTDGGFSWGVKTLPMVANGLRLQIVNDWFIIYTGSSLMYRSKDAINWEMVSIEPSNEIPKQWTAAYNTADGTLGFVGGRASVNGYFLRTSSTHYSIPGVASTSGKKWMVKAKK